MNSYFADLHIHVGCTDNGTWVKIPTSPRLTVRNILYEAECRKGIDIVGIVDAMSPPVLDDLRRLETEGLLAVDPGGGYRFDGRTALILGAEIETSETDGGQCHSLVYLPDIHTMARFSETMAKHIRNIGLSSQNAHMTLGNLIDIAVPFGALIVPAHIFTPHKGLYGAVTERMLNILSDKQIEALAAVELGLSADSMMADRISELERLTFITNSDAHSPDKIGREYNLLHLNSPSFSELALALARKQDRRVEANYGLDPRLGKYHRTMCEACGYVERERAAVLLCPNCGSKKVVRGVFDRIDDIADYPVPRHPGYRPPYFYQIPLGFIPGVGKKTIDRLLAAFGSEMAVIHQTAKADLATVVGDSTAEAIVAARSGKTLIVEGAGGVYGKLMKM